MCYTLDMKTLACIDPAPEKSGFAVYDEALNMPLIFGKWENSRIRAYLKGEAIFNEDRNGSILLIEDMMNYGMPSGKSVFTTCMEIGRFIEAWPATDYRLIGRKSYVTALCGYATAKDKNVRQGVIDHFIRKDRGYYGAGKEPLIGTKKEPGILYGCVADAWNALAIALVWADKWDAETRLAKSRVLCS